MARKNDGLIWHLMDAPWWLSVVLSAASYLGLSWVLPSLAARSDNFILNAIGLNLPTFALPVAAVLLIPAPIALFKQVRRKQRYLSTSSQIRTHNNASPLNALSWIEFESYVGEFFKHQGYDVKQSFSKQTDGGVDIWLTKDGELSLVQCKHWKARKVGVQVLREMYGVMIEHQASKMIIVTSGDFTAEAITFAQGKRLWLVNGSELVHMIEEGRSLTQKPVIEEPSPQFPPKLCPNCHSELVVRIAKKGQNAGKSFYGCTAFPKCRYTCDC